MITNGDNRCDHTVTVGPLAEHEVGLRAYLAETRYSARSIYDALTTMARLSAWLHAENLAAGNLTTRALEAFLAARQREVTLKSAHKGLPAVLAFLRGAGVVPDPEPGPTTPVMALLADYRLWLKTERSLAAESVRCYVNQASKFLAGVGVPIIDSLCVLDAATVTQIMLNHSAQAKSVESAKAFVTAVRSLLRFLLVQGLIPTPLTGAVPAVAGWRLGTLPRGLSAGQPEALLAAQDTTTGVGLRAYAILMVLARLGLRGAEVAALRLVDVDWRAGEITVRGKGSRVERLPLPIDVGEAIAAYLTRGRPACDCPTVFVTARAPFHSLTPAAVRGIMGQACRRARLPRVGAHRLRHTLATNLLRAGSSLAEVGQVLRHRSQLSTTVYANPRELQPMGKISRRPSARAVAGRAFRCAATAVPHQEVRRNCPV
jgi:site-specific recombinase XerD